MDALAYVLPGTVAYMHLPSDGLRATVDSLFPQFARLPIADSVRGAGHRWVAGHDLLIDVPQTFIQDGVVDGFRHLGHIVLTDFPTKAGIPIPLFSESGFGHLLKEWGIHSGWLNLTICDAGFGILAIAESHADLIAALAGHLDMNVATYFDTFVEGSIEVMLSCYVQNPLLLYYGGIENILAGIISTWKTFSVYVDPWTVLGGAFGAALVGGTLGYLFACEKPLPSSVNAAMRSASVGAAFSVSAAMGFGAFCGMLVYSGGRALAKHHTAQSQMLLSVNQGAYQKLIDTICRGDVDFIRFVKACKPHVRLLDKPRLLPDAVKVLPQVVPVLDMRNRYLKDSYPILNAQMRQMNRNGPTLDTASRRLPDTGDLPSP